MDNPILSGSVHLRVLLADDNEPVRRHLSVLLRNQTGLELVGEAVNGEDVVHLARKLTPDVVVMDVVMPGLNGIDATRRIKSEFPSITVIALSMHGDDGFRRAMLDAGAAIYLLKDNVLNELPKSLKSIAGGVKSTHHAH